MSTPTNGPRPALPPGTGNNQPVLRVVALVLLGVLGFLGTAGILRGLKPYPERYEFGPKLEVLAEQPAAYDLAYVGSSTVFRHFVPSAFDARMAEHGYPIQSYNLGAPALGSFELDHALRQLADVPGLELDFVLVEPSTPQLYLFGGPVPTEREVDHHDLITMARVVELFLDERGLPWSERIESLRGHLRCFAWCTSNYGQWERLAMGLRGEEPLPGARAWAEAAGYQALEDDATPTVVRRGESFLANPSGLVTARAKLERVWKRSGKAQEPNWPWFRNQIELLWGIGARPVLVISARAVLPLEHLRLPEGLDDVPLLVYSDPKAFPNLYRPEARFDKNHLTREAAEWLSRRLADDLVAELGDELDAWLVARDSESSR